MHKEIYDRIAASYDSNTYAENYRLFRALNDCEVEMLDRFLHGLGRNVLSVGCGGASVFEPYIVNHGFNVSGVDISSQQIVTARTRLPKCNFWVGNFLDTDDSKAVYNGILCMYALFNFIEDDQQTALQKMYNLVKPDGRVLLNVRTEIHEGIKYTSDWCNREMYWYLPGVERIKHWCVDIGFDVTIYPNTVNKDYVFFLLEKTGNT